MLTIELSEPQVSELESSIKSILQHVKLSCVGKLNNLTDQIDTLEAFNYTLIPNARITKVSNGKKTIKARRTRKKGTK